MKQIFSRKQVKRFFESLEPLKRSCVHYYPNESCAKTIFVQRLFKGFHPYWMVLIDEPTGWYSGSGWNMEEMKLPIIRYISIANISYYLGYGDDVQVMYYMAGSHVMQTMKIDYSAALYLKGQKITKKRFNNVSSMFIPKIITKN
jgi:hypothetical protein